MADKSIEDKIVFAWQKYVEHLFKLRYRGGANEDFIEAIEKCLRFEHEKTVSKRLEIINVNTVLLGVGRVLTPGNEMPKEYKKGLALFIKAYGIDKFDI